MSAFQFGRSVSRLNVSNTLSRFCARRKFSILSEHTVLPATLYRLNDGLSSNLYPKGSKPTNGLQKPRDAVTVSEDGFVRRYFDPTAPLSSSGARLMPNTFTMQEYIRMAVDQYLDDQDAGIDAEEPMVFTLAKGTKVPNTLLLLRGESAFFSLQPREPMTLAALNEALTAFYRDHGQGESADAWLDKHEWDGACDDGAEETWMAL